MAREFIWAEWRVFTVWHKVTGPAASFCARNRFAYAIVFFTYTFHKSKNKLVELNVLGKLNLVINENTYAIDVVDMDIGNSGTLQFDQ